MLTYLFRQDGRYYYRRRVPKDIAALIGKSEIKISLGYRCSVRDAKHRLQQAHAKNSNGLVEMYKVILNTKKISKSKLMTITTLVKYLRSVKSLFITANRHYDSVKNVDNIFGGLDFSDDVRQEDRRIPWAISDLNKLFAT